MKKEMAVLLLFVIIVSSFSLSYNETDISDFILEGVFVFPSSLITIEDEAFAGTGVQTVILPEGFVSIQEYAFKDALGLSDAYIPSSIEFIADSAFDLLDRLNIHGIAGSYAQEWAEEYHARFVEESIWKPKLCDEKHRNSHVSVAHIIHRTIIPEKRINYVREESKESKRPQDRSELNPIDYKFP